MKKIPLLILLFCFLWPLDSHASEQSFIIINKASNELAHYENNELYEIFPVATGKSPLLTPEGHFQIVNKIVNRPYYKENIAGGDPVNPLGDRWLGLNARGTMGSTYAIHGNNNPNSIGKYVSLGCVRMDNDDIRWLFDMVNVKTPVIIVHSLNSFDELARANGFTVISTDIGKAPAITHTLFGLGSTGEEVKALQQHLSLLGYEFKEMSGIYDEDTIEVVKQFQRDYQLIVDGYVGQETKRALRRLPMVITPDPEKIQDNFRRLGFYLGESDFIFGYSRMLK
ncbi:hypothetical protein DS745_22735 [Anaerobacillus alkaliphilus]|uniref:L,D-TPase catalytic domain-containing protein n=1 Tax=Anaerobacillus alkaliphilus TaxID=1548597 RepID=A0A4Q0VMI9_9BACI|nr:L,D-transpeptidase family protein [Anaerobacillus alkaliphilus]RXI96528.1 hypothetical protein DS745_22735 [Anaerobacillus alkaliphilus]